MLQTLFARCLAVSLAGASAAALLGLLHLAAGHTLGVKWQYYSWLPVLLVMLAAPLLPLPEAAPAQTASQAIQQVLPPAVLQIQGVQAAPAVRSPSPVDWMLLLSILWLAGAAVVLLRNISSYREVLRGITRAGVPLTDGPEREQLDRCLAACGMRRRVRLCRSAAVDTPLLAGVFRPVIVLPDTALSPENLRHIFSHELTHCRRNDLAYKWLAVLACALHWFNPAVYLMLRSINRLCELSCDQCVIAGYDAAERRQYMQTILRMLSASVDCRRTVTTAMSAGGRMIEKRLRLIQRNRQIRRGAKYAGAVLTVLLTRGADRRAVHCRYPKYSGADAGSAAAQNSDPGAAARGTRRCACRFSRADRCAGDHTTYGAAARITAGAGSAAGRNAAGGTGGASAGCADQIHRAGWGKSKLQP